MPRRLALTPLLPALSALALLAGCPSFTTMGTARTLDEGKGQFFVATGAVSMRDFQTDASTGASTSFTVPTFELGGRYAVSDRAEVGGKVWPFGAELNTKFALVRSPTPEAGVSLALAPAASVYAFSLADSRNATYLWLHAPFLVGFAMPGGSELTIGPRLSDMLVSGGGTTVNTLWAGGSLGFAWRAGKGFRILPEVSASWPVTTSLRGTGVSDFEPKGGVVQANLGFLIGGE